MDDERTYTFYYSYHPERPLTEQEVALGRSGRAFPPELIPGSFYPKRNRENEYLLDRELQRTTTFTGIYGVNDQDRPIQESMGAIYDRTQEHLGTSDLAVIAARRRLMKAAKDLQQGIEPYAAHHGEVYRVGAQDVNTSLDDFEAVAQVHGDRMSVKV